MQGIPFGTEAAPFLFFLSARLTSSFVGGSPFKGNVDCFGDGIAGGCSYFIPPILPEYALLEKARVS